MLRSFFGAVCVAWCAMAIAGCGQAPATQLIVVVDTDYALPAEIDEIDIDVTGPDGMHHEAQQTTPRSQDLPYTLTVVPNGTALGPIRVVASGLHAHGLVVSRAARVTLVASETRMIRLDLLRVCDHSVDVCTSADQTCGEGGHCQSIDVAPGTWSGVATRVVDAGVPPLDATVADGGPNDGGPPNDGGTMPDASGGDCRTSGCDDHEPCTDDVCGSDGRCTFTNNTIACDDHVFCNGMDTCGGGTCSVHVGNPCSAGTCDEPTGRCLGCSADSDCPAQTMGAFGACGDFPSTCATDGTHSRTVRTFHCVSNACTPTDTTDTQPCTRTTDGTMCGSTSCTSFGACGGFSGTCGTSGTQSRTCTDLTCSAGTCGSSMRSDSQACSRSTDGTSCMATSCGAWSACGGFADTCATSGTQTRTCTDYNCSGGSCAAGSPRTESQACSRSTDGTSCMATSCGAWSACPGYADTCATSASQTRSCTDYACSGGSCVGAPRTESQVCMTRTTDGTLCMNDPDLCRNLYCSGGTCSNAVSTCTGGRHCCFPGCYLTACP